LGKPKKYFVVLFVIFSLFALLYAQIPEKITIIEGNDYHYSMDLFQFPGAVKSTAGGNDIYSSDTGATLSLGSLNAFGGETGEYTEQFYLFHSIPIKSVDVKVIPNLKVVPVGRIIGVKLETQGLLIVGMSDVYDENGTAIKPLAEFDVRKGDIIQTVNEKPVSNIDDFKSIVENSDGKEVAITLKRDDKTFGVHVNPVKNKADGKYRLGIWVRDSTAGIGTMTFYQPETKQFGALGHGITDSDTGQIMEIKDGELTGAEVVSIKKGENGTPGELKGMFSSDSSSIGTISSNSQSGIYGKLDSQDFAGQEMEIAPKNEIKEGKAKILCNIDGGEPKEYDVEVEKVSANPNKSTKCMVIRITDNALLEKTGGIVQGMSGSPIIQNGKLIGAVTHVFINDPTRGYGIFIENMLIEASKVK